MLIFTFTFDGKFICCKLFFRNKKNYLLTYLLTYVPTYLLLLVTYLLLLVTQTLKKNLKHYGLVQMDFKTCRYCENSEALEHSTNGIQSFNINTLTSVKKTFEKTKKISPNTKTVFLSIIFRKDR